MSYNRDRDNFIVRMTQEGLPYAAIQTLLRCATSIERYAELACSSEAAYRDRVRCPRTKGEQIAARAKIASAIQAFERYPCLCGTLPHTTVPRIDLQSWRAEQRAIKAVPAGWQVLTAGDPRGYTLSVIPPSYADRNAGKDRFNLDSIGVPARPSRVR